MSMKKTLSVALAVGVLSLVGLSVANAETTPFDANRAHSEYNVADASGTAPATESTTTGEHAKKGEHHKHHKACPKGEHKNKEGHCVKHHKMSAEKHEKMEKKMDEKKSGDAAKSDTMSK